MLILALKYIKNKAANMIFIIKKMGYKKLGKTGTLII